MADLPDFDKLWDFQVPDETERKFRELLPRAEASGDRDYHLQLLTQVGRTLGLQGKFAEAHALLDEVEGNLTDDLKVARVRCLLERGRAFNSSKKGDLARPAFLEAWELARSCKADRFAVDAAHMMAIVAPPDEKLSWNVKGMELAEGSGDESARRWLGTLYNNIGWDYHDDGEYERALEVHRKG